MPSSPNAPLQQFVVITGQDKGSVFPLPETGTFRIGRSKETDTHLNDAAVSRNHCQVILRAGQLRVLDQQSHLGTFVNGQRITEHTLRPGDVLRVGDTELRLESAAFDEAATRGALPEHIRQAAQIASAAVHRSAAADMRTSEVHRDPVVTAPGVKGSRSAGLLYVTVALLFLVGVGVGTAWWQGYLPGMDRAQPPLLAEVKPGAPQPAQVSQNSIVRALDDKVVPPAPPPVAKVPAQEKVEKPMLVLDAGGHTAHISMILFTPDGRELISSGADKTIRFWNIATGTSTLVIRTPIGEGSEGKLYGLALSPDGRLLAACGFGWRDDQGKFIHPIFLIDRASGRMERILKGHTNSIIPLTFSPDSKHLASGSADRTVRLWNVATGESELVLRGHKKTLEGLSFSADGKRLVSCSAESAAKIWSLSTGAVEAELPDHESVKRVAWNPDGKTILTGDEAGKIRVWNADGSPRKHFDKLKAFLSPGNCFTPDSRYLLCLSFSAAKIVEVASGAVRAEYTKHNNSVICAAASPDGQLVASGDLTGTITLWRAENGELVSQLQSKSKDTHAAAWSKDGRTVAWGTVIKGRPLQRSFRLSTLEFDEAPDGSFLRAKLHNDSCQVEVVNNFGKTPRVLIKNGTATVSDFTVNGHVYCTTLLPEDRVAVGGHNFTVHNSRTGKLLHQFNLGNSGILDDISLSPDNRYLVTTANHRLSIWALDRTLPVLSLYVAGNDWIAWTPEGYYAASSGGEQIMGWQVSNGLNMASYYPASQFRKTLYRPDVIQQLLASGTVEKALAAADAAAGKQTRRTVVADVLPPKVAITSPKQSGQRLSDKTLEVEAVAESLSEHPVTSLRLFLDGRPAPEGTKHFPTPQRGKVRASWTVEVPPGSHRLSVQATSAVSKSDSDEVEVSFTASTPAVDKTPTSTLYVLAIGINAYPGKLKLDAAVPDAQDITHAFERYSSGLFRDVKTKLLLDKQATRREILIGLNWLQKEAKTGDVVVVFYAGHGDSQQAGEFHLLPIDVDTKNLARSGVSGETLKNKLGNLPCTTLMILDACFSGSFSEGNKKKKRALPTGADNLVREFIYDAGLVVMCGAAKEQEAAEENGHGLFTRALVEALSGKAPKDDDGMVDLDAVQLYVARQVRKLSDGEQEPTIHRPSTVRSFPLSKP